MTASSGLDPVAIVARVVALIAVLQVIVRRCCFAANARSLGGDEKSLEADEKSVNAEEKSPGVDEKRIDRDEKSLGVDEKRLTGD
jgi:hypothetical protein